MALVALLAGTTVACSNDAPTAVDAGGGSTSPRGSVADTVVDESNELAAFSQAVSQAPLLALTDFSVPRSPEEWASASSGTVRGVIESIARGPDQTIQIGVIDGVERSLPQMTLALQMRVSASSGGIADNVRAGETVRVIIPIWQGAEEEMPEVERYLASVVDLGLPEGTEALVAARELTDDRLTYVGISGVILGTADGSEAQFVVRPGDGTVMGFASLDEIEASTR